MADNRYFEGYWDYNDDNENKDEQDWLNVKLLISLAKSHKLSDSTIKIWADTSDKPSRVDGYNRMKEMSLGACFMTPEKDYYMYSFKTNRFYFFKHTKDAIGNLKSTVMGTNVVNAIKREGIKTLSDLKKTLSNYRKGYEF